MATALSVTGLKLVAGGVIENGKWRQLSDSEAQALATGGENGVRFQQTSGRGGVIKDGVVESEAYLSDLMGLANEDYVNTTVATLEANIKDGVDPSYDTFAEAKAVADSLQAQIDAKPDDADIQNLQSQVDAMNAILASDDDSLNTAQEWVDFIKNNKSIIDALPTQADVDSKVDQATYDAFVAGRPQHVQGTMTGAGSTTPEGEYEYTVGATSGYKIDQITADIDGSEFGGWTINNPTRSLLRVVSAAPLGSSVVTFHFVEVKNA